MISEFHKAPKNTLTGFVEKASINDFQFDNQRKTFISYGYAINPSSDAPLDPTESIIGNKTEAIEKNMATVFETTKARPKDKRKRVRNDDPSDIEGFLGPWAVYKDQELVSKPTEEQKQEIEEFLAKKKNRASRYNLNEEQDNEKSVLHINDPYDYLGRSFLHIPQDLDRNLKRADSVPEKCFMPKKLLHTYTGHTKGIQRMKLFPVSGHLFLTCSMDSKVKVVNFNLNKFDRI